MASIEDASRRGAAGMAALIVVAALLAFPVAARLAGEPPPAPRVPAPVPPTPPELPVLPDLGGSYTLPAGQTHTGNLRLLLKSHVVIAGKQIGDVKVVGGEMKVPGEITGSVTYFGNDLAIDGKVGEDVEVRGANFTLNGKIDGDLDARCANVDLAAGSQVLGDADLYAGQLDLQGKIDGELTAAGGQIKFGGTVGKDASLEADLLSISPDAKVQGNLTYNSRVPVETTGKAIAGGRIEHDVKVRTHAGHHVSFGGKIAAWIAFLVFGTMCGLGTLAVFRRPGDLVLSAVGKDVLRNLGTGFLTIVVVPVALALSCIFLVTIPFAVLALLLFAFAVYLSQVPVGVWIGRFVLTKLGRPMPSPYVALVVGLPILYLLFLAPLCIRPLSIFFTACLGTGAMVFGLREAWQRRKRARAGGVTPATPAASTIPPDVSPEVNPVFLSPESAAPEPPATPEPPESPDSRRG